MIHSIHFLVWLAVSLVAVADTDAGLPLEAPVVFVQIPVKDLQTPLPKAPGMLPADYGEGARLVLLRPGHQVEVLSIAFESALDPDISFDGTRILFSAKRGSSDHWNIFEMRPDGSELRRITEDLGDCRNPVYQSTLYTIVSSEPWYQIAFSSNVDHELNEYGSSRSTSLYSCKLDGSEARRLTYNISSDLDPFLLQDGRMLFSSWQRSTLAHGTEGRILLCAVNIDGTDFSLFTDQGKRIRLMPCATSEGRVIFVESDRVPWDGAGQLASVTLRRPFSSYQQLTQLNDGLFHSPSPLPDGTILVSRRPADNSGSHGIYRLDPVSGRLKLVYDDPNFHEIQAKILLPREEPDGRSSVVTEEDPHGQLYCLNSELTDLQPSKSLLPGTVRRLRVLEGVPRKVNGEESPGGEDRLVPRRLLGEIPVESDGSFFLEVPANIPIQLQTLDEQGLALQTCGWIWVKNHEPRGCIGCHEDPLLTPVNRLVEAVQKEPYSLTLPPERRRMVSFKRHVAPLVVSKCASVNCHAQTEAVPKLSPESPASDLYSGLVDSGGLGKYVHPTRARTSPLIWHVLGLNTSRPWDSVHPSPVPDVSAVFSPEEKRILVEWIDMGAAWDEPEAPATVSSAAGGRGEGR